MAITKTAECFEKYARKGFIGYLDKLIRPLHDKGYNLNQDTLGVKATRSLGRGIGRLSKGTYNLGRKGVVGGIKGIGSYGRFVAKHPKTMVPATLAAAYAPYRFKDRFQKNFYHTDPNINHTYQGPLGISYYNKPMMQERNKHQNFIY